MYVACVLSRIDNADAVCRVVCYTVKMKCVLGAKSDSGLTAFSVASHGILTYSSR